MDWFSDLVVDYVWSPIIDTLEYIWDFVLYCFVEIWDLICDFTMVCAIGVLDLLPEFSIASYLNGWDISGFLSLISTLDLFFPISECFVLVSVFILAVSSYAVIKLIVKLIPTIG